MSYKYIWKTRIEGQANIEPFIKNWREASVILQEYPGAKGTRLHKVLNEPNTYLAIAEWESIDARNAIVEDTKASESERAKRWQKFSKNESFGTVVTVARVDEIDSVMPK